MTTRIISTAAVLLLPAFLAFFPPHPARAQTETDSIEKRGNEAANALASTLLTTLATKMAEGGMVSAIDFCHESALPLTSEAGAKFEGVKSIRRTALRFRNPANAPDSIDREVLEKFLASWNPARPLQTEVRKTTTPDGSTEIRFYRSVPVMATCLACHGPKDQIAPEVLQAIAARYPLDQATGFSEGELRGAIVVGFGSEKSPASP